MNNAELLAVAKKYRSNAYVPYSNFPVGAAVLTEDGKVYGGCNVESASYGATCCGERTAVFKAVSEGSKKIKKVAIVGKEDMLFPCGICRQVLSEFGTPEVILEKDGEPVVFTFEEILPHTFTKEDL